MKIFIVEDERITAEDIRIRLEKMEYTVVGIACSGEAAIERIADADPDFVLMDIILKGEMDGVEAAEQIRTRFNTPAVYITGHAEDDIFQRAKKTAPLGYILKPLDDTQFRIGIEMATELYKAEKQLRKTNQKLEETIVELKATRQQVIQQERLRALGQMASGIAHDFNNSLQPILGFSELLINFPETLDNTDQATKYLTMMRTSAQDAAVVVKRLREFYRQRDSHAFEPVNLNNLISQVVELTKPRWKNEALTKGVTIEIKRHFQKVPFINGNSAELREAITNLIFNATDAMKEDGAIILSTSVNDKQVVLEVSDTGCGMIEEDKSRCFDPFFSTKQERGTGLGLSMVFGVIQRHEGEITVESSIGVGTTFTIRLPIPSEQLIADNQQQESASARPMRVLVVEDESLVLQMITEYLTSDGHTVETAADGREGLWKFNEGQFDLVVTDRSMPGMNGDQLTSAIKQIAPRQRVVMLTGFGDMMQVTDQHPPGVDEIVSKPVTLKAFREVLARGKNMQISK